MNQLAFLIYFLTLCKLSNNINKEKNLLLLILKNRMDVPQHQEADNRQAPSHISPIVMASAIDIIRTETVLSRMPRHILSKSGKRPEIRLERYTDAGKLDMRWWVSFNELYGAARQLAYDLDTLIIERAIEETFDQARRAGRSLPRLIPIGSVRDLCRKLYLEENGTNIAKIKRALQQNAGAVINAVIAYDATDSTKITIDATFTCYGVFFTGKTLPDGRRADQTYISTTNEYHHVLSTAPTRPLDYSYKLKLAPTARRLYEILSYPVYGSLMNKKPFATLLYSDYCMRAPHVRYFTFDQVKKQMYKVNKPHKESGYITKMKYEYISDREGNPDWMLLYEPGPRARAEFHAIHYGKKLPASTVGESHYRRATPHDRRAEVGPATSNTQKTPDVNFDPQLVSEFTKRGVNEKRTYELLANLKPGQKENLIAQLEHAEEFARRSLNTPTPVRNPGGYIARLIELNTPVPDGFETSAKRKARLEAEARERKRRDAEEARQFLEDEYERYCINETDRYIAEHPDIYAPIKEAKLQEQRRWGTGFSLGSTETMASIEAKHEIRKQIPLLTFEEFVERRKQGSSESPRPAPASVGTEPEVASSKPEDLLAAEERRDAKNNLIASAAQEPVAQPQTPPLGAEQQTRVPMILGPMIIELVSDPPEEEPSDLTVGDAA